MKDKIIKYLRYALGEIFLIAIGILLAINIDNYVAHKQNLAKEQIILNQLKGEFQHNKHNLTEKMMMREDIILSSHKILDYVDSPKTVIKDSLIRFIGHTLLEPSFEPIEDDLISTGNIKLITNDTLRKMLTNWPSEILTVKELEQTWKNYIENHYVPLTVEMGIIRDIIHNYWSKNDQLWKLDKTDSTLVEMDKSKKVIPIIQLLNNKKLEGSASIAISHNKGANIQSMALLHRIEKILGRPQ